MASNVATDPPPNFTLGSFFEELKLQKLLRESQGSEIKCQACDEGNQATSRCMDCNHFLCQECHKQHGRMAVMKSHEIFTMAQFQAGNYTSKLRERVSKCTQHPDQTVNAYCNTCGRLVCTACSNQGHKNHSLTGVAEASYKCKQRVADLVAKAEENKTAQITAMNDLDKTRKELQKRFADTHMKISIKAKAKIDRIKEEERRLKEELETIFKDRVKSFETAKSIKDVTEAECKLDEVNQLMDRGTSYEILHLEHELISTLNKIARKQPHTLPDRLLFVEFEEGERSLGRLVLAESEIQPEAEEEPNPYETLHPEKNWQLKTEIKTFGRKKTKFKGARDVTTFSDGKMVVIDRVHRQLIECYYLMKTSHPLVISDAPEFKDLLDPSTRVSASKDNHLIVLRDAVVRIVNRQYHLLHQFKPGRGSDGKPTCLAVDENNLIAVGFQSKREISLHRPDGSLFKTLPAPLISRFLTTNKQRLIYTNFEKRKLLSVDYNGNRVFSTDIPGKLIKGPTGVCCDSDGSIYVAVQHYLLKDGIHQFSPDGKYLGCVIHCISPCGMTFAPDGQLVVAANESVQIYNYA